MTKSSLLRVELVLLHQPNDAALQDISFIISRFLGPPPTLTLAEACSFGSIRFLNWIWDISLDSEISEWSLTRCMQLDEHYRQDQFIRASDEAASSGNVEVLTWLLSHFPDYDVLIDVVEVAVERGHLGILKLLMTHIRDRQSSSKNIHVQRNGVHFSGQSLELAIRFGHLNVARWLIREAAHEMDEKEKIRAIKIALGHGHETLAQKLLPPGKCILDYARLCRHPEIIEWNYDCGYLKRDQSAAIHAFTSLTHSRRFDLMKKIAKQHEPLQDRSNWRCAWRDAIKSACSTGGVCETRWLVEHPMGRRVCEEMRQFGWLFRLLWAACDVGNVPVMQYLYEQGLVDGFGDGLLCAIRGDRMKSVKWILEYFPPTEHMPDYSVLVEAARHGRLEMLQFFQRVDSTVPGLSKSTQRQRGRQPRRMETWAQSFDRDNIRLVAATDGHLRASKCVCTYRSEWCSTDAMDEAAANGQLEVVQWLHSNRTEGCTTNAMDEAAANGYLEVVQWLHANRSEGCTTNAIDYAARNGHLEVVKWLLEVRREGCTFRAIDGAASSGFIGVVKWLHANGEAGCSTDAMDLAASGGHLAIVKWLHANRTEGCTDDAIINALCHGHLRIAHWLRKTFPERSPILQGRLLYGEMQFDKLLFLHAHYPDVFTEEFVRSIRKTLESPRDDHISAWLEHHYKLFFDKLG
ncbi:putative ankyrin repeat protein [Phytophthora citrophthora]|uniref:Ankyrin repeat protein n=1 Tax=Phytophthora citrophthora TaxID=4793 RepID=A0AAD9G216_9STRA|nr:putative ankyrin repeat protein [Phytophthora citrophthora]